MPHVWTHNFKFIWFQHKLTWLSSGLVMFGLSLFGKHSRLRYSIYPSHVILTQAALYCYIKALCIFAWRLVLGWNTKEMSFITLLVISKVRQHWLHKKAHWVKAKAILPEFQWRIELRTKFISSISLLGMLILSCCCVCLYQLPTSFHCEKGILNYSLC